MHHNDLVLRNSSHSHDLYNNINLHQSVFPLPYIPQIPGQLISKLEINSKKYVPISPEFIVYSVPKL